MGEGDSTRYAYALLGIGFCVLIIALVYLG